MIRSSREKRASSPPMGPTPELRDPYHPDSPIDPAVVYDKPSSTLTNVRPVTVKVDPDMNKKSNVSDAILLSGLAPALVGAATSSRGNRLVGGLTSGIAGLATGALGAAGATGYNHLAEAFGGRDRFDPSTAALLMGSVGGAGGVQGHLDIEDEDRQAQITSFVDMLRNQSQPPNSPAKVASLVYNMALATFAKEALAAEGMALGTLLAGLGAYRGYAPRVTLDEVSENVDPLGQLGGPSPEQVRNHKLWRGVQKGLPTAALGGLLAGHPLGLLTGAPNFARGMAQGEEEMAQALLEHAEGPQNHMRKKLQGLGKIKSLDDE